MARKPRTPDEPVEPETPAEPEREEEKLPWLQRVEDDEPSSEGAGGRLAGYAIGAALLIVALVAIGYAIVSRQHAVSPNEPQENLSALLPDQSTTGNAQAGNESAPASTAPGRRKTGEKASRIHEKTARPRRHKKPASAPGQAASGPTQTIQLGAYDSRAAAEGTWNDLSGEPPYSGAAHRVERARVNGHVYYRLRVDLPAGTRPCAGHGDVPCMVVRQSQ
jgi:cell division protein FtsN